MAALRASRAPANVMHSRFLKIKFLCAALALSNITGAIDVYCQNQDSKEMNQKYSKTDEYWKKVVQLGNAGDNEGLIRIFEEMLTHPREWQEKALLCVNLAIVSDTLHRKEDALKAYDRGILIEKPFGGYFALEAKAAYLANISRFSESVVTFRQVLDREELKQEDRESIEANLRTLDNEMHNK